MKEHTCYYLKTYMAARCTACTRLDQECYHKVTLDMCKWTILLDETIEAIDKAGKRVENVLCVSIDDEYMSWSEFKNRSTFCYDEGYGTVYIALGLRIVFSNSWLGRHDYDGAEKWKYYKNSSPKIHNKYLELRETNCHGKPKLEDISHRIDV